MKKALVLGGGGAKGSYEVGAINALHDLAIEYNIVTGTSIGSLNGFFASTKDLKTLNHVWENISKDQVLKEIKVEDVSLKISSLNKLVKKNRIKADENEQIPLKNLIDQYVDEEKIRQSNIEFGLVCVSFPSLKPLELSIKEIPQGKLADFLLASCTIFPIFPMCEIEEKLHIDGGYHDNVPIDLAINMGAFEIIAIDVFKRPAHIDYLQSPFVKYINPSWDLSPILSFKSEFIEENKILGYNDTLKEFGKALGFRYTFEIDSEKGLEKFSQVFSNKLLKFEANVFTNRILVRKLIPHPLTKAIREHTDKTLTKTEFFIRALENCMECLDIKPFEIYNIHQMNEKIIKSFLDRESYEYIELFKKIKNTAFKVDKHYLIGCILYKLLENEEISEEIYFLANIFPKETVSAFYVYSIIK